MGCATALFTLDRTKIALMPCNPSIGGPGKGHLVREIDALGGEMARNTDRTSIQIRMLNTGKGPAVQSLRAQSDKHAYSASMAATLHSQPKLTVIEASVDDLVLERSGGSPRIAGIRTGDGQTCEARSVVLTTGTFLRGRIIMGDRAEPGGRAGEFPADALSQSLATTGFTLGRLKTGTPPRVSRDTIEWSATNTQTGSERPLFMSFAARLAFERGQEYAPRRGQPMVNLGTDPHNCMEDHGSITPGESRTEYPSSSSSGNASFETSGWRSQLNCFLVHTNAETHDIIRRNLDRAPMYNGEITATGPRYCPSIEAKIVRFADKPSHQLFLEPEGWNTDEIYVQGANTSLPVDVQRDMLRTIHALRDAELARPGYAIEYDYVPALQVHPTLETKPIQGLFMAGQIIGTTGYEEAGALGIMAGVNAARAARDAPSVVLRRDQAYIGVLIDDLVTKELDEPYRMHTSQAEYRLLLREDSAEARLSPIGHDLGLLSPTQFAEITERIDLVKATLRRLDATLLTPSIEFNAKLADLGVTPLTVAMTGREALRRKDTTPAVLQALGLLDLLPENVAREVETTAKYEGYIARQASEVRRLGRMGERRIPGTVDYATVQGLRTESREKLERVRPRTIGQATRIGGVPPSDVALLLFHIEREARQRIPREDATIAG
jgi:tRNA uridine 5-carboxymethylaminomethyl modification enzyme